MEYEPNDVTRVYLATFAPRLDVYSVWTEDGWRPVREPIPIAAIRAALYHHGPAISAYMIAPGSVTHVAAIDFDTDDGLAQAHRLGRFMAEQDLVAYIEESRRGAHLWCVLDYPISAVSCRQALRALMQHADIPEDVHIELRPGSDYVKADGLGHALRMPMMPHPKTGLRFILADPVTRQPLGKTMAEVLLNVQINNHEKFAAWAERWKRPPLEVVPKQYHETYHGPDEFADASASDILRERWGVMNARPNKAVRCPAHNDEHPSLSILADDKRAICKAPHCVLNNNDRGRGTYELTIMAPKTA